MNNSTIQPTAFSAAEIDIESFIDLDAFPIHDLTSNKRQDLVKQCQADLEAVGCSHIPDFINENAITEMKAEAHRLMQYALPADDVINPYLTADNPSLPADHPKRFYERRTSAFINSDHLEQQSYLRKIYDCDVVVKFIADCLNSGPIYRWADPLGRNPYSVMHDGDYFPWHFDGNEFTVSILVQESNAGGDFEYCPDIRTPHNENFDQVKSVLQGNREPIKILSLKTGDLQIFKGRYSMHRVTHAQGESPRIIALPTYVFNPYLVNKPHHAKAFYGRAMDIHHSRNMRRLDNLTD